MEQENFTFGEKKILCVDDILSIKNGKQVGYTVKGFVSDDECKKITNDFFSSPYLYNRLDIGGGVHQYVGPYISGNVDFNIYMKQVDKKMVELRSVLGQQSCIDRAIEILREYQFGTTKSVVFCVSKYNFRSRFQGKEYQFQACYISRKGFVSILNT